MSTSQNTIQYRLEDTYGVQAAGTYTAIEAKADSFKRPIERIEAIGFRKGLVASPADRVCTIAVGGEGSLEWAPLINDTHRDLFEMAFAPANDSDETAYYQETFRLGAAAPTKSATIQVVRSYADADGVSVASHVGAVLTKLGFEAEVGNVLMASADFMSADVSRIITEQAAAPYEGDAPYCWLGTTVTLNGAAADVRKLSVEFDMALDTERKFLGRRLTKVPVRSGLVQGSGSLDLEFQAGLGPIVQGWAESGATLALRFDFGPVDGPGLSLTIPAAQLTSADPAMSMDKLTELSMPFVVMQSPALDYIAELQVRYIP